VLDVALIARRFLRAQADETYSRLHVRAENA
jgi:hypothetical protein